MTKPVSYYVQAPEINALVERYGDYLERLTQEQMSFLLVTIAGAAYGEIAVSVNDDDSGAFVSLVSDLAEVLKGEKLLRLIEATVSQLLDRHYSELNKKAAN